MVHRLYTIGYERRRAPDVLRQLADAGVEVLVDVRELPLSRIHGFSKSALASASARKGVEYRHVRQLGSPRWFRHRLAKSGDFRAFTRGFLTHLRKQTASVRDVQQLADRRTCCLFCFERDYRRCHRQFVASEIKKVGRNGLVIEHL